MRKLSAIAILWAFLSVLVMSFAILRGYAAEYEMPYIDFSQISWLQSVWVWVLHHSWYIGFACLILAFLLALGLIIWHLIDLCKYIKRKIKHIEKPPSEWQILISEIRGMRQDIANLKPYRIRKVSSKRRGSL